MDKFFNIAGPCIAADHYMVPVGERCAELRELVQQGLYFVIHAPRQTGKTTLIQDFVRELNQAGDHLALYCSLETAQGMTEAKQGIPVILEAIRKAIHYCPQADNKAFAERTNAPPEMQLNSALSEYCAGLVKPLVIMFDEIDCLADATLISFLRQLRQGYVERGNIPFVHALALVGMRNIRDYKASLHAGAATLGSASPFNIVSEVLTIPNFSREQVAILYHQHTDATGQSFPEEVIERVYHYTNGQPWLCNAIAREMVTKLLQGDTTRPVTLPLVERAVENIIQRRDTHIDSLLERLKEERVRRVVEPVILGRQMNLDFTNDDTAYTFDLGLLSFRKGDVAPANPIYGEVIIRMLTYNSQYHLPTSLEGRFIGDGALDLNALLKAFQGFWRENADIWSEKYAYREAAPHLILQAYLQRVVNGGGRIHREYSAGRGRIDLCIQLSDNRYPIELKIRHDKQTQERGLQQLAGYMSTLGLKEGWLVIFERDPNISWDDKLTWQDVSQDDKLIHIVGC